MDGRGSQHTFGWQETHSKTRGPPLPLGEGGGGERHNYVNYVYAFVLMLSLYIYEEIKIYNKMFSLVKASLIICDFVLQDWSTLWYKQGWGGVWWNADHFWNPLFYLGYFFIEIVQNHVIFLLYDHSRYILMLLWKEGYKILTSHIGRGGGGYTK